MDMNYYRSQVALQLHDKKLITNEDVVREVLSLPENTVSEIKAKISVLFQLIDKQIPEQDFVERAKRLLVQVEKDNESKEWVDCAYMSLHNKQLIDSKTLLDKLGFESELV